MKRRFGVTRSDPIAAWPVSGCSVAVCALAVCIALLSGCTCGEEEPATPAEAAAQAARLFGVRCAPCHGKTGAGDGPSAPTLNPRPPNFHDPNWHAKVTDQQIEQAIRSGGPSVGKSVIMPPNPDLVHQPLVVEALRELVRSKGQK